jgi:transcriptional regulator with PAS, ATPase and Fis domain
MQTLFHLIRRVAKSDATVLIQGESGTGKELIATTIHGLSARRNAPFIKVNCAALPEGLLESELFGHEKGAFTGAIREKPGRFELADKGTIFLDEVGEVSPPIQVKLLRVLQERAFERVGGTRTIRVDVRIIAASNRDLQKAMQEGKFRDDFFYRLDVIPITVPPLRERKEDIPYLVFSILQRLAAKTGCLAPKVRSATMRCLQAYDWPGNVRELENVLEFAVTQSAGATIQPAHLRLRLGSSGESPHNLTLATLLEERERQAIRMALGRCGGDLSPTARVLGIGRTTLWRKMKRYGLLEEA